MNAWNTARQYNRWRRSDTAYELSPDLRDAFEEHLLICHECALDVRAEALAWMRQTPTTGLLSPPMRRVGEGQACRKACNGQARWWAGFARVRQSLVADRVRDVLGGCGYQLWFLPDAARSWSGDQSSVSPQPPVTFRHRSGYEHG